MLYLEGRVLLDPTEISGEAAVVVHEGRILAAGPRAAIPVPDGATRLELGELLIAPGWIDLQVNGGFGWDFTSEPGSIWQVGARLPEHGVTAFLPTIVTSPPERTLAALEVLRNGPPPGYSGALPLGLHVEGPFLNPEKRGAHNPAYLRLPDLEMVRSMLAAGQVRLLTLAPELPGALDVVRFLAGRGVAVSAGHSQASWETAQAAFEAGVSCGTHLFNAMPPLDQRAPGLIAALLTRPGIHYGLIADGIHVHPGAVALAWQAAGAGQAFLVTDAMAALGMPSGAYSLGDLEVIVDETSARLKDGRLAGSILRMDQAVRNLAAFTGCGLARACAAASSVPAQAIGEANRGRIAAQAHADLTILTPDLGVAAVMVAGQLVYQQAGLDLHTT